MSLSPPTQTTSRPAGTRLVPWLCLAAAICWSVLLRVPLVLNAPVHLDSDLAVDGLTLQETVQGHWRWHYPGSPYMGTGAVLLSWCQARIWGANPVTLVSGGIVAHVLLTAAVFALAWRVFGRGVAMGGLLPLAFASTGVLWLSGRITGGHLLIVAWSAVAWLLVHEALVRGRWMSLMALGVWCGLGVYLDSMFLMTLAGVLISGLTGLMLMSRSRRSTAPGEADGSASQLWLSRVMGGLVLCLAFLAGAAPRAIGRWVEPYDAYNEQFSWSLDSRLLAEHARILLLECLPRLVAGHRLPGLEADPDPSLLGTGAPIQKSLASHGGFRWWTLLLSVLALGSFTAAMGRLAHAVVSRSDIGSRAIAAGMLASAAAIGAGFLVNRNIFSSDNYRYLVLLLVPWSIGHGLVLKRASQRSLSGRVAALACAIALAALFTCDAAAWYRRLGWIDDRLMPVRRRLDDPALRWLLDHPEVRAMYGSYWDVYRLSFLTGGKVKGVPFPVFPNRFPEWSASLPGGRPETLLVRRSPEAQFLLNSALRDGGLVLDREGGLTIVSWPEPKPRPGPP